MKLCSDPGLLHLHIQVMSDEHYFPLFGNLLPFRFSEAKVKLQHGWQNEWDIRLANGGHYRFEE